MPETPQPADSAKPRGRKAAIDAMCRACLYDPHQNGTWRQQIEGCSSPTCPLYPYRPRPTGS